MIGISELKEWLNASDDALPMIEQLEISAVAFLEQQTDRYFGILAPITEFVSGAGTRDLTLREEPATSPAPVVEIESSFGVWTVVSSSTYTQRGNRLVTNSSAWAVGRENYRVTYTRGYAPGTEPADVRQAVKKIVEFEFNNRGGVSGLIQETVGEYSYRLSDSATVSDIAATVKKIIARYARPAFA